MVKTVFIGIARMGSTRLRGKVMMDLGGQPVIAWVTRAAKAAIGVDEVWIATSTLPADDTVEDWCHSHAVNVFRGSETDVLSRFLGAAEAANASVAIRVTCDCPLIDPNIIGEVVRLQKDTGCDYASNVSPRTFADGQDCEAVTIDALRAADKEAIRPIDRECVTTWIQANQSRFSARTIINPISNQHKERYVLDTAADYEFCKAIATNWPWEKGPPSQLAILDILDKSPALRKLNTDHEINQRYYDALVEEPVYRRSYDRSQSLLGSAEAVIPLGTQTFSKSKLQFPQPSPLFLTHGQGGTVWDVNGNSYTDLVSGLLPNILGYCDPNVDGAIRDQLSRGISFSLATELEAELAELLVRLIPCAEMVRFGKTGTDATTCAVRLARAYTGRNRVLICGGYHGWADWSCERTIGIPGGIQVFSRREAFGWNPWLAGIERFAAVIVEPESNPAYLKSLREYCDETGTVLIFDEVITGFRFDLGGAQKLYGVTPDLACFGKAMANGMPLSAIVGRRDIMKRMEPPDNIFYSGTFFGEALSLAAGIATIKKLERDNVIDGLWFKGADLGAQVALKIEDAELTEYISLYGAEPLIRLKFKDHTSMPAAGSIAALFRKEMIATGTLIIASHNICAAHGMSEIKRVLKSYDHTLGVIEEAVRKGDVEKRLEGGSVEPMVRA